MEAEDHVAVVPVRDRRHVGQPVLLDEIGVGLDAETGAASQVQQAVLHPQRLAQQAFDEAVAGLVDLDGQPVPVGRDDVAVGDDRHRIAPTVRSELEPRVLRHPRDPDQLADAAAATGVGLQDVRGAAADQFAKALDAELALSHRDRQAGDLTQRHQIVDLERLEGLLEPEDPVLHQVPRQRGRHLQVVAPGSVGHQVDLRADGGPGQADGLAVVLFVDAGTELDPPEALLDHADRRVGDGLR